MTRDEALRRLDEIERMDPDASIDVGAFGIMQEVAQSAEGLRLLVERYGSSTSANVITFLALVLAEVSNKSTPETAPLVFEFVARLRLRDHDGALISSIGAMCRQIGFGAGWGETPRPPYPLYPFVKHCLDYTGKHSVLVQFAAVDLVTTICWGRLLPKVFEAEEIEWIKARVKQLSQTDEALLTDEIAQLEECLAQENQ